MMPASGPRILHLVPADGIGGVEIAAKSMAARDDLPCDFRLHFIEPVHQPGAAGGLPAVARAHWRAMGAARAFDPDVIVCSLWRSVPLAVALRAIRRRAKLVYFLHFGSTVHRLDALASAVAMRVADEIWADSAATLQGRGVGPERGRVISFVTEHAAIVDKPFAGPGFVSWGRLHHQKGFDRAIRLIGRMVERGVDATYDIYGPDGGERDALIALIAQLGLDARVRIHGAVARHDLAAIASTRSFFLQPSRLEGMCMAAVEAMQLGLVPVATAVGQMAHYVVPGRTGIVVEPDEPDPVVTAIARTIADPARWRDLSRGAMRYWADHPLYADDVCRTATDLLRRPASI